MDRRVWCSSPSCWSWSSWSPFTVSSAGGGVVCSCSSYVIALIQLRFDLLFLPHPAGACMAGSDRVEPLLLGGLSNLTCALASRAPWMRALFRSTLSTVRPRRGALALRNAWTRVLPLSVQRAQVLRVIRFLHGDIARGGGGGVGVARVCTWEQQNNRVSDWTSRGRAQQHVRHSGSVPHALRLSRPVHGDMTCTKRTFNVDCMVQIGLTYCLRAGKAGGGVDASSLKGSGVVEVLHSREPNLKVAVCLRDHTFASILRMSSHCFHSERVVNLVVRASSDRCKHVGLVRATTKR
jgi:hypothetical protein